MSNALEAQEIVHILHVKNLKFVDIYAKDRLPKKLIKKGWYIVSTTNYNEPDKLGHLVCFKYRGNGYIDYFDSVGNEPIDEVMKLTKKRMNYSTEQLQAINTTTCGYFVLAVIAFDRPNKNKAFKYEEFFKEFAVNPKYNDNKLLKLLKKLGFKFV